ncbi:uncharacterized protein LOC126734015 isoform X2 [Anthonomus grandis grandis]|uniref:uncharacterized protein LOC126734015 isoform X2 n=1 Tax=Anthonomus grandis grandis TaxID=2921223 RepID=UPI00216673A5|nr:uncharacterized protein LOC126734015 isoform X2 [Anthonomus grandis grandis]
MLIIFHYFGILFFQILKNRKRLKIKRNEDLSVAIDSEENLKFDPPVYRQRFRKICEILSEEKWKSQLKKIVDFGCAEFGLFVYLKNLTLEEVLFIDIDEEILEEKVYRVRPLLVDQLQKRQTPLEIFVFRGSIVDPDYRLRKTDVVTAIELIEHLYPDTLEALPYNIFFFMRPKIVIITTPNADFNVMFNHLTFRHPDHKFEWSREQFEDWAKNIIHRFPEYTVNFHGIGDLPDAPKNIGSCSQAALFIRKDMLNIKYISPIYAAACRCDKNSLCKGKTIESKLLCTCLCAFCLPDISVGICTYFSCNLTEIQTYRPMKTDSKKSLSDTDLLQTVQMSYHSVSKDKITEALNPSCNIFYKLVEKVVYPYEVDERSENDKILELFKYRVNVFSHVNSRFYMEDSQRCEIPIEELLYGNVEVSPHKARNLLREGGFTVEKCIAPESGDSKYCIISTPREMENITSSSEVTDNYSSKSSDCNEPIQFEANNDHLSDWDEVPFETKDMKAATSSAVEQGPTTSIEQPKKPPDPLFDSGYLKSPSPLESNPQLPQLTQDNLEAAETDQFEEIVSTPNLHSNDNKLHLKKTIAKEKFVPESQRVKLDPHRINELDRFYNMCTVKTFMNNHLKPQNEFKKSNFKDFSVAGTSSNWKKTRRPRDKEKKVPEKKELEEPTILDDARSLTNCIVQNSLNKVEVKEEVFYGPHSLVIRDFSPVQERIGLAEVIPREPVIGIIPHPIPLPPIEVQPAQGVENGDLANNNRDNEGNNLGEGIEDLDIDEGIDLLNDNLEDIVPLLEDNVNPIENNNDVIVEQPQIVREEAEIPVREGNAMNGEDDVRGADAEDITETIAQASREALYDENSEQDLLEDFDVPPQAVNPEEISDVLASANVILVGVNHISSTALEREATQSAGTQMVSEEEGNVAPGSHDEPHFYCQGDGLGVHPSVMALEVDEAEDADDDTTTIEDSSSNNTTDYAEVDPGPSDMFDMSSLPEESSVGQCGTDDNTSRNITNGHDCNGCDSSCSELRRGTEEVSQQFIADVLRTALDMVTNHHDHQVASKSQERSGPSRGIAPGNSVSTSDSDHFESPDVSLDEPTNLKLVSGTDPKCDTFSAGSFVSNSSEDERTESSRNFKSAEDKQETPEDTLDVESSLQASDESDYVDT